MKRLILNVAFICGLPSLVFGGYPPEQRHYWDAVMPIMRKHCNTACHNADDLKGGLNLNKYDFIKTIQRDGEVFFKVVDHVENATMPPPGKPELSQTEKDTLLHYINKYLGEALNIPDPGLIPPRRLSNREYRYVIKDLTGVEVNTDSIFPQDPSGGEGFDNFAKSLYITPLLMERYFEVAENVVKAWSNNKKHWRATNQNFKISFKESFQIWWNKWWNHKDISAKIAWNHAQKGMLPFATLAYRRPLSPREKEDLGSFFKRVYIASADQKDAYQLSLKEVYKLILVSHNFLLRSEGDPPKEKPYLVSNFELASRLSFFLWSSIPDFDLLEAAYRKDLHHPKVLNEQIDRMLKSPKVKRMAEGFATQWLGIDLLKDPTFEIDDALFPEFTPELRSAMHQEVVEYFSYAFSESKNLLELLDGEYSFINEDLASHYGIEGVRGTAMRKIELKGANRGGILGMAGVHTVTSLPNRTSPVLRGKWVMEKILNSPAKPPPPNIPELEQAKEAHDELDLRKLLVLHRSDPACSGCHQEMDDLGFALESFDAIGRWRESYQAGGPQIDISGTLKSGEQFDGPIELKKILIGKKDRFAKAISKKILGYALGRSIEFKDSKTVDHLAKTLMDNNFNPNNLVQELVYSYPFRYKKSDPVVVDTEFGD